MNRVSLKRILSRLRPQEKLLYLFSFLGVFSSLAMSGIYSYIDSPTQAMRLVAFAACFFSSGLVHFWFRSLRISTLILLLTTSISIVSVAGFGEGLEESALYWLLFLPLLGGLLVRRVGVVIGTLMAWVVILMYTVWDLFLGFSTLEGRYLLLAASIYLANMVLPIIVWQFIETNTWELETKTQKVNTLLKIVTHDIANPLTVIHGMSEAMIESVTCITYLETMTSFY